MDHIASYGVTVGNELQRVYKEVVAGYFKILFTSRNSGKPQKSSVTSTRDKDIKIQSNNGNHSTTV